MILFMSQLAGLICPIPCSNLGPLGNMNNAQQFHGRDVEAVWDRNAGIDKSCQRHPFTTYGFEVGLRV